MTREDYLARHPLLEEAVEILRRDHGCHTVLLYGSYARGDFTSSSDLDLMGARDCGEVVRDGRLWKGVYLDLFVYPEHKLAEPDASMLHMRGAKVLVDQGGLGTRFLARLEELFAVGPKKLPLDEIQALKTWGLKSLARVRAGDVEGNFRRAEMLPALLEFYFTFAGQWYRGPKESFLWLRANDPEAFAAFERALLPGCALEALEGLVELVNRRGL